MCGGFLKPKFYKKCKSILSVMKIRLDIVKKKKKAVSKFLKTDIVELIKNGHDYNAYTRTEALLEESKRLSCYDLIEQFCDSLTANLANMMNQKGCSEECREAVSSLVYAAARIPEVPELKQLRAVFTKKYENPLESFLNRELVEKLERRRPAREKKIQTMQEIAREFSISWDSKALQEMLIGRPSTLQNGQKHSQNDDCKNQPQRDMENQANRGNELRSQRMIESYTDDKKKRNSYSGSDDDNETIWSSKRRESTDLSLLGSSSSSSRSKSEDEEADVTKRKPLPYRLIPPPYTKPGFKEKEITQEKRNNNEEEQPTPRSFFWQRFRRPQGIENVTNRSNNEASSSGKGFRDSGLNEIGKRRNEPSIQHPKLPDYDELVARIAEIRRG